MKRTYKRICESDRRVIEAMLNNGKSPMQVAVAIGVHENTIRRERTRGIGSDGLYHADLAQKNLKRG